MSDTPAPTEQHDDLDGPIAPRGRAVGRLLARTYGACAIICLAIGVAVIAGDLRQGVTVSSIRRLDTPRDVLRPPQGWIRTADASFRSGAVSGSIERWAVPRRRLDTPARSRATFRRYLDDEFERLRDPTLVSWGPARPLPPYVGYIAQLRYENDEGRTMHRIDHLMFNVFAQRAWGFRATFPAGARDVAAAAEAAASFPDHFTFPGIHVPVVD